MSASEDKPFLAIQMAVDTHEVADLGLKLGDELPTKNSACPCGLSSAPVDYGILDTMTRLVMLLKTPQHLPVLEPLIKDRQSTRLNSSHVAICYAVFFL